MKHVQLRSLLMCRNEGGEEETAGRARIKLEVIQLWSLHSLALCKDFVSKRQGRSDLEQIQAWRHNAVA